MPYWNENNTSDPKVLVACPTYAGCAYSLERWADAFHAFTYPNKGALMVDNSDDNLHYTHLVRAQGIPCIYEPHRFNFLWDTLELSWRKIVEYAHDNGYDLIASIEADVICPPEALTILVDEWKKVGPKAIVAHRYHPRGTPPGGEFWFDTLGCTLFPTELLYQSRDRWMAIVEVELYLQGQDNGYERARLRDLFEIEHLDDPDRGKVTAYPQPANDRLHPGVATVKRPIPRGEEASAKRSIFSMPHGAPADGEWHGRREEESPLVDAEKAQESRDNLKWDCLQRGQEKTLEEQNRSLRLLCNQLFAEIDRIKEGSCA